MKDKLGKLLLEKRIAAVLPLISGRALDLGCGTNELMRRYGGQGTGVDVYQWGRVDLVVEDSSRLPFEACSFDTVTCVGALNHIPNRQDVLLEVARILKPNGHFLMTMIPPRISKAWHSVRKPWDADQAERGIAEGEVWGFTTGQLQVMYRAAGLNLKEVKRFMLGINRLYVCGKA